MPIESESVEAALVRTVAASVRAGEAILQLYDGEIAVTGKADSSPLTEADLTSHRILVAALARTPVGSHGVLPVLSEEGKEISYQTRRRWELFWLVDPLDGTKEFLNRNGEFTVNIALIAAGRPVAGVIYLPVLNRCYYGLAGDGAYLLEVDARSAGEIAQASFQSLTARSIRLPASGPERPFTVIGTRSHATPEYEQFLQELTACRPDARLVSAGSSLKFCRIAEGCADLYPRMGPTMEWDTAAGHAIANAAGRKVKKWGSEEELVYNKEDLTNPWFVVE